VGTPDEEGELGEIINREISLEQRGAPVERLYSEECLEATPRKVKVGLSLFNRQKIHEKSGKA